jgi:dynein heavy chain 2
MARIFIGLVKCGAWGCFDEFNRLEEATLSAISMQIQPIQVALKFGDGSVKLLDEEVSNSLSVIKFLQYVFVILSL